MQFVKVVRIKSKNHSKIYCFSESISLHVSSDDVKYKRKYFILFLVLFDILIWILETISFLHKVLENKHGANSASYV